MIKSQLNNNSDKSITNAVEVSIVTASKPPLL